MDNGDVIIGGLFANTGSRSYSVSFSFSSVFRVGVVKGSEFLVSLLDAATITSEFGSCCLPVINTPDGIL